MVISITERGRIPGLLEKIEHGEVKMLISKGRWQLGAGYMGLKLSHKAWTRHLNVA